MLAGQTKDVSKMLILAAVLVLALGGLYIWNQKADVLDPAASKVYSVFVSR